MSISIRFLAEFVAYAPVPERKHVSAEVKEYRRKSQGSRFEKQGGIQKNEKLAENTRKRL